MKKYKIDLFSDTNTDPAPQMRRAMCYAAVGNEAAGEDPTVNQLLEEVCALLGKDAAMFLPSGTMCNGIAYRVLCQRPGDLIILDRTAHPLQSASLIAGLVQAQPYVIDGIHGIFSTQQIEPVIAAPSVYNLARPRLVSIEQTTNLGGGAIWPLDTIEAVCQLAHRYDMKTHLDGARLLNAVAETKISAADYAQHFDSVWIDFSKCLGAPMGAVLAGTQAFINEAWYYKFQQGGAMHQAGILAAGCLYGLKYHAQKLSEIHLRTKQLAKLLSQLSFLDLNLEAVQTNIIIFGICHRYLSAFDFKQRLGEQGIRVLALDCKRIRMIMHLEISSSAIEVIFNAIRKIGEENLTRCTA